jgi:hypothetical protein
VLDQRLCRETRLALVQRYGDDLEFEWGASLDLSQ